ncbi:hypothetical protein [Parapedobacter koreensis]|uniref:Uncharacterized protein n=1 Tax=Parapedobacter koreensis TaxID=332977 RepID=A0A1H7RBF5_9SPHI|nr:hypothetical protein [Parapedobacter koreensis]SEL57551.1 hypothetical protein SAMN05421740_10712 [Parapedobacter koreensis]
MQIILDKVQKKHLALINELAKTLKIEVIEGVEDDRYYLDAMKEGEKSPLLDKDEKDSFLRSLTHAD